VSQVAVQHSDDQSVPMVGIGLCSDLGHTRCPRCWRWVPALETSSLGPVCPRCIAALNG
jgi:isoleucyl-tRNA synthetase